MKQIIQLFLILLMIANIVNARDVVRYSQDENSNYIIKTKESGSLVEQIKIGNGSVNISGDLNVTGDSNLTTLSGIKIIKSDQYIISSDFFFDNNWNGNVFCWKATANGLKPSVGNINLTLVGDPLTSIVDHLGNNVNARFNGSSYYYTDDSVFNFNGNFSVLVRAYRDDWSSNYGTGGEIFVSKFSNLAGSNFDGWAIAGRDGGSTITDFLAQNNNIQTEYDTKDFDGRKTLIFTRDSSYSAMINDGTVNVYNNKSTPFLDNGNFTIGAVESYGQLNFNNGAIFEVCVHKNYTWTPNQARLLDCRGSGEFCTQNRDGEVYVNGKQQVNILIEPGNLTGQNNNTYNTYSGWKLYIPENGEYKISAEYSIIIGDTSGDGTTYFTFKFAKNGISIPVANLTNGFVGVTGHEYRPSETLFFKGFLKLNDYFELGGYLNDYQDTCTIRSRAGMLLEKY